MTTRTDNGRSRLATRLAIAMIAITPLLGACSNDKGVTMEQLQRENEELRDREAQLQAALEEAESRAMAANDERARLQAELESRPTGSGPTGFEGLAGTQTSRRGSDIVVDVAGDVLFASGSVTLRKEAKATLDSIADTIKSLYSNNDIEIAGHTDSDPIRKSSWKTNERLSAERALAVEEYLASRGLDKDQMHIAGFGPAQPKGSKSQSRRVEIVILGG